jgi:hypothetical protein
MANRKSTKKVGRMEKIKKRFARLSRQKQVSIMLVAAVVIIGVGFLVKSFAATANYSYTLANGLLFRGDGSKVVTEDSKNGQKVLELEQSGSSIATTNNIFIPPNQSSYFCITGTDPNVKFIYQNARTGKQLSAFMGPKWGTIDSQTNVSATYKEYCIRVIGSADAYKGPVKIVSNNNLCTTFGGGAHDCGVSPMKVAAFTLKFYDPAPPSK